MNKIKHRQAREALNDLIGEWRYDGTLGQYINQQEKRDELLKLYKELSNYVDEQTYAHELPKIAQLKIKIKELNEQLLENKIKELEQKIDELQKVILKGQMIITEPEYLTPQYAKNYLHEMIKTNFFISLIKEKYEELSTLKSWQFRKIKLAKAYITWYSKKLEETYYEVKTKAFLTI